MSWLDRIWPFPVKDKPQTLQGSISDTASGTAVAARCLDVAGTDRCEHDARGRAVSADGAPVRHAVSGRPPGRAHPDAPPCCPRPAVLFLDPDGTVSEDEEVPRLADDVPKSTQLEVVFWTLFMGFCIGQNVWDMDTLVPRPGLAPRQLLLRQDLEDLAGLTREGFVELTERERARQRQVGAVSDVDRRAAVDGRNHQGDRSSVLIRQVCLPDWLKYAKQFTGSRVLTIDAMVSEIEDVQKTLDACQKLTTAAPSTCSKA